jgi:hypothetical protein
VTGRVEETHSFRNTNTPRLSGNLWCPVQLPQPDVVLPAFILHHTLGLYREVHEPLLHAFFQVPIRALGILQVTLPFLVHRKEARAHRQYAGEGHRGGARLEKLGKDLGVHAVGDGHVVRTVFEVVLQALANLLRGARHKIIADRLVHVDAAVQARDVREGVGGRYVLPALALTSSSASSSCARRAAGSPLSQRAWRAAPSASCRPAPLPGAKWSPAAVRRRPPRPLRPARAPRL